MPFRASTSIHYTPRHSCCAHLRLSAAAPSCDQPDPTVPYVDTSIVSAVDACEFKEKKKMNVVSAFLHTVRPAVCLEEAWILFFLYIKKIIYYSNLTLWPNSCLLFDPCVFWEYMCRVVIFGGFCAHRLALSWHVGGCSMLRSHWSNAGVFFSGFYYTYVETNRSWIHAYASFNYMKRKPWTSIFFGCR